MPTGFPDSLTPIARFVEWYQPRTVLDIGVGGGRTGFLAREYGHHPWHPRARGNGVVVHGIEGYEPYLGPVQRAVYDELLVEDAVAALARLAGEGVRYDLLIAADILEHFEVETAREFLGLCSAVGTVTLVATPRRYFDQSSGENPLEDHRSHWSEPDLVRAGATQILHRGASTVCLFGDLRVGEEYRATLRRPLYQWVLPAPIEDVVRAILLRVRLRRARG